MKPLFGFSSANERMILPVAYIVPYLPDSLEPQVTNRQGFLAEYADTSIGPGAIDERRHEAETMRQNGRSAKPECFLGFCFGSDTAEIRSLLEFEP